GSSQNFTVPTPSVTSTADGSATSSTETRIEVAPFASGTAARKVQKLTQPIGASSDLTAGTGRVPNRDAWAWWCLATYVVVNAAPLSVRSRSATAAPESNGAASTD